MNGITDLNSIIIDFANTSTPSVEQFSMTASTNSAGLLARYLKKESPILIDILPSHAGSGQLNSIKAAQKAAAAGNLDHVKFFVENGVKKHESILHSAAEFGHLEVVKWFLSDGNRLIASAMQIAEKYGQTDIVDFLSSKTKLRANSRITPSVPEILDAARNNERELFLVLIEKLGNDTCTTAIAMSRVAKEGDISCLKFFIENKIPVHETVLNSAAESGHLEIVQLLFDHIPSTKHKSLTEALVVAKKNGRTDVVDWLKLKGVSDKSPKIFDALQINPVPNYGPSSKTGSRKFSDSQTGNTPKSAQLQKAESICSTSRVFSISKDGTTLTYDAYSPISTEKLNELGIFEFERHDSGLDKVVKVLISTIRV